MRVHDVVKLFMKRYGVETVFSLMSDGTKKLATKIHEDEQMRIVEARHEQNAMGMADGYTRVTGEISVCMVGRGPAVAQTGTALETATREASQVLVLVPTTPLSTTFDTKEFQQDSFLRSFLEEVFNINDTQTVVPTLQDVFQRLERNGGPIAVQVPWDLFNSEIKLDDDWEVPVDTPVESNTALAPQEDTVDRALELYRAVDPDDPPVIVVGRGAMRAEAKDAVESFASRLNAVLVTSLQARGYLSDNPHAAGFIGGLGAPVANSFVSETEFIVAFGASLNPYTIDHGRLIDDDTTVVHVDLRRDVIGRHQPVDLGIVGDARLTAKELDRKFEESGVDCSGEFWTEKTRERIREAPVLGQTETPTADEKIDPRELVRTVDELVPEQRLLISDGGHFQTFVVDGMSIEDPDDFLWTVNFASIGLGLPMGLGASVAEGDRFPILFCGDAGFSMSVQELNTAVREDVPVTIVVMNDGALGSEYHQLDFIGEDADPARVAPPEFGDLAEAFGATGYTVQSVDELLELEEEFSLPKDGPTVIDCKVDDSVRHRAYEAFHGY